MVEEFRANLNLVNKRLAEESHKGTSFDPEKRATQEIEGFGQYVNEVYDNLKKYAKTEAQQSFLNSEMDRFQHGFAVKYNDRLAAQGRTISSFITGGSNFPVRRAQKANVAEDKRYEEMIEYRDRAQAVILRELKKMGVEEAGGELEVLKDKLERAKEAHEIMVKSNKILRSKSFNDREKVSLIKKETGLKEETILKMLVPDYMGQIGFPSWNLQNSKANIHRMEERVKELEKKEATPSGDIPFEGGKVIDNREQDRIQIFFNTIPSEELRGKLKSEGWHWSPSIGAWQRKRTENALYSARRITGAAQPPAPAPAVQPQVAPPITAPQPQVFVPAKEEPKIEDEVHARIQKVIDIMKIYRDKGATYEDLVAGLKGYYLEQSGYVMGSNLNVQKLTDDLKKSGYHNLRELWRAIIVQAPERKVPVTEKEISIPSTQAHPPLLYPAPPQRPAEEIMLVPNPEKMTRDEYVKEKYKRMAQVLRQQGKNAIAERVEKGAKDPERTFKYETSHRDQVVLALAQNKAVSPEVLKDYPDIVGRIRKENEEILAKIKAERERIKAIERAEENELNAELNKLPPPLKRHAETEIYGTLHLPETHKDYRNRYYIALGKVRRIAFAHLPGRIEPQPLVQPQETWQMTQEEYWRAGAGGKAYEGRGTSDYNHKEAVYKAIIAGKPVPANVLKDYPDLMKKEVPEPTGYFSLKKAQELSRENKLKLSDEQLREKSIQVQDYIRLIESTDEYSRKTLIKGGYYAGVIHPDVTGIVPVDIWLLQNLKFTLEEFDKEQQRRKQEKIKISVPTVPAAKPVQSIQDIKQQVINSIQEAKSMDELKQILKGLGFLPLPESEKRQLIDLYQIRFSELRGELKFGERIPAEEKKKRRVPQKVPYAPPTRRLEEYGIKEAMRRGYGYA